MMTPNWTTKLRRSVAAVKLDANLMLDQKPLTAAAICAAVGGVIGLVVGVLLA